MNSFNNSHNSRKPHTVNFLLSKIKNSHFENAIDCISDCHKTTGLFPKSMLLAGLSGAGKSDIATHYHNLYPQQRTTTGLTIPVLYVPLHEVTGIGSLLTLILKACCDPKPTKGSSVDLRDRIQKALIKLHVELIIIDDIHNVLPSYTEKRAINAATLLRSIIDINKIPIILVGLPTSQRLVTLITGKDKEQKQLAGRFLSPYYLDAAEFGSFRWKNLLTKYQEKMGVPCISLATDEMQKRFYVATEGLHRGITNVLSAALELSDGQQLIDLEILTKAYRKTESVRTLKINPFSCELAELRNPLDSARASHIADLKFWNQLWQGEM